MFQCNIQNPDGDALTTSPGTDPNDFNSRQTNSSTGIPPSNHRAAPPGTYTFTLKVRDARGAIAVPPDVVVPVKILSSCERPGDDPTSRTRCLSTGTISTKETSSGNNNFPTGADRRSHVARVAVQSESRSPVGMQAGSPPYYYDIPYNSGLQRAATLCMEDRHEFGRCRTCQLFELQPALGLRSPPACQGTSLCVFTSLPNTSAVTNDNCRLLLSPGTLDLYFGDCRYGFCRGFDRRAGGDRAMMRRTVGRPAIGPDAASFPGLQPEPRKRCISRNRASRAESASTTSLEKHHLAFLPDRQSARALS